MIINHIYKPIDPSLLLYVDGQGSRRSDNKVSDLSGNRNHGIIQGAVYKNGPIGQSVLYLDGVDDLVRIPVYSNYIRVDKNTNNAIYFDDPTSNLYRRDHFYVMQYQARNFGGVPKSTGLGLPWTSITQTAAITACNNAGGHLMTNDEWMAIARDIEQVAENWTGGVVGSGILKRGNVGLTDVGSYDGGDPETGILDSKAILKLSNGNEIYHFSGNVWEWTNDVISCAGANPTIAEMPFDSTPASEWIEFTAVATYGKLSYNKIRPSNSLWNSNYGMGRLYTDADFASPSGNIHTLRRGGRWGNGVDAGAYTLYLGDAPSSSDTSIGFRCVIFD